MLRQLRGPTQAKPVCRAWRRCSRRWTCLETRICRCDRAQVRVGVDRRLFGYTAVRSPPPPRGVSMALPLPVEKLWDELERARAGVLGEAEGLSQRQADYRPSERDWSVGEIIDHLTLAEINTGKLTTKLLKEAGGTVFPADLAEF